MKLNLALRFQVMAYGHASTTLNRYFILGWK